VHHAVAVTDQEEREARRDEQAGGELERVLAKAEGLCCDETAALLQPGVQPTLQGIEVRQPEVLITDRGHPAFVMLNIDEYHRLQGKAPSLFALMQQLPELPDDVFEVPRMDIEFREIEF
jgi:hypothetical protein